MKAFVSALGRFWLVPVVLVVWELAAQAIDDRDLTPPTEIVARMHELWFSGPAGRFFFTEDAVANILPSMGRMFTGWVISAVIGVLVSVVLGRSARAAQVVDPLVQFGRAIPPPMLLPLFIVLFQAGTQMQLATIVFGVVWPVLINSMDGARTVDRLHIDTGAVFGLTRWERLRSIILPSAAPKIFAGLRLSVSLALILMVISELVGSTDGIGYQLRVAQRTFEPAGVWAAIALLGILGFALNGIFTVGERYLLSWHRHARRTA